MVKKTSNRVESVDCLSELIQSHKAESQSSQSSLFKVVKQLTEQCIAKFGTTRAIFKKFDRNNRK